MIFESQTKWAVWILNKRLNSAIDRHWFRHGALNGPGGQTFALDCANSSVLKKQMETTSKCGWTTWFELNGKRCCFFFFTTGRAAIIGSQYKISLFSLSAPCRCDSITYAHMYATLLYPSEEKKKPQQIHVYFFPLEIFMKTISIRTLNSTLTVGKVCAC